MRIYKYSGTFTGFLCVIFTIYKEKEPPLYITSSNPQYALDAEVVEIEDSKEYALRVENSLRKKTADMEDIITAFASGQDNKESVLFQYIRLIFRYGKQAQLMQANPHVIAFRDMHKRVTRELERLMGFLRFKELSNGILYAQYEPDNDLTQYMLPYFSKRNALTPFIIHDTRRNILGMYNTKDTCLIQSTQSVPQIFTQEEALYQRLWRQYFNTVTIPDRENRRQQLQYMPRRYRKNMSETY